MSGSVAFIIDIAGAKLRNAHLPLLTLLCSLQSGAGVRSATLNRCAPPIGNNGAGGALVATAYFSLLFSHLICGGLAWSATRTANIRSAVRRRLTRSSGPDEVLATHTAQMGNTVDVNENEYAVASFEQKLAGVRRLETAVIQ